MKKFKTGKKIFSAIAALAISVTAAGGVLSLVKLNDKAGTIDSSSVSDKKTVAIDTAVGVSESLTGNVYYTAPDATQNKFDAKGTKEDPFYINNVLMGATDIKLQPGDTLYVLPGVYNLTSRIVMGRAADTTKGVVSAVLGTYDKYIRIVNAALEEGVNYDKSKYPGTEAVLDFSTMSFNSNYRGVTFDTDYIYWCGVDVRGAGDNGMYIGGSYNTVEYCEFYNNRDTGLQLGRSNELDKLIDKWPSYNLIKNCTSHNNYDNETFGENADGFAAKLTVGFGNVFDGCIAYRNSDDGWDLYAKTDSGNIGTVILYNCVAFENGYLEYTRDECNSLFPTYDERMDYHTGESSTNPYMTRDGDGNGFKLGGSIMEGDVVLYNCLAFNNRMHGVTDNSNPGYLKLTNVTSYNNSAMVDENGKVAAVANKDNHSNIDVSRQKYSYNSVNNVLSVRDSNALSLDKDAYRGTVKNSLLDANGKTNVILGSIEGDTINGGQTFTSQIDALVASTMFKALPNDAAHEDTTIRGNNDSMVFGKTNVTTDGNTKEVSVVTSMKDTRVHVAYRNADYSINMHDILAKTEAGEALISAQLDGETAGSTLNLNSWAAYKHFYENELKDSQSNDYALAERARDALTLNTVEEAVYQDFEVPVKMLNASIEWTSSNENLLEVIVGEEGLSSSSGSEYARIVVWRDKDVDKNVVLTATISYGSATVKRDFNLTLKKGTPMVGEIYVEDVYGEALYDGEKSVIDMYSFYPEPEIRVLNGLYPDSQKLLKESEYKVKTSYSYQVDGNAVAVAIKQFTPSVAGVYTIKHEVSLAGSDKVENSMSYQVYVASLDADVAFIGDAVVTANREGFAIAGNPSSATGILYAVSSATELTGLTADGIKTQAGVASYEFRDTAISFNFKNENTASYYVYYALANANGKITSQLYTANITRVDINTAADFAKLAGGSTLGDEEPSQTVYVLTKDIDCADQAFTTKNTFTGVFNGMGHTLSNLSSSQFIFYKINGGTIMNLKVDGLTIESSTDKSGFVSECLGGDFYNIAFTNVNISGSAKRVAALIGHVGDSDGKGCDLTISQVSIVNDEDHSIVGAQRVAGLIGFVQNYKRTISIDNCQVISNIEANTSSGEGGGLVATWEDNFDPDKLNITQCYYSGLLKTPAAPGSSRLGGMLGYHKGGRGVLNISRCISLATFNINNVDMENSVKNSSPILGNFSTSLNAVVSVSYCIGLMQEYNTDYDVQVFTLTNLKRNTEYMTSKDYLMLDMERWTAVENDDPDNERDIYKAPYMTLNFLGDWD